MKRYISMFFYLLLLMLSFQSCSSDSDNNAYANEVIVKEKIKGKWTIESMIYESNYEIISSALNESSKTLLNNDMYFTFMEDSVITTSVDKITRLTIEEDTDPYVISNGSIYIYDNSDSTTYIYTYVLTNKRLKLTSTLSRNDVIEILEKLAIDENINYSTLISSIPKDLSINYSFNLKR